MFIAYYAADNIIEKFETFELAKNWLEDMWREDGTEEGFADETINSQDFIAKVTHKSKFIITHKKEDYKENEDGCLVDKEGDFYPVSETFDQAGDIVLEEI